MKKTFLIGIPIRDFDNPMSRLSNLISKEKRVDLSKNLIINLESVFSDTKTDIYVVSNNNAVKSFCNINNVNVFKTEQHGLNEEIEYFLSMNENYKNWTIVHGDLPYITKHYARIWINLCESEDIVIAASKDNGTPIFGGSKMYNNFLYGKDSFIKHTDILKKENTSYKRVFHKEFNFEIDDEKDYLDFIKHKPRWYKKITNTSSPDRI